MTSCSRRRLGLLGVALLASACTNLTSDAHLVALSTTLKGDQEVPPVMSMGQGQLDAVLDRRTRQLRWKLEYTGLTGPATAAHFHGPAQPGSNAGVQLPLASPLSSPSEGAALLTEAQAAELLAGRWYVNVHTAAHPGGEIRGQVSVR